MESGSRISYTKTLEEQTSVYLFVSPPNLSMMLVWKNLADPHLSVFSDFARFSQTLTLKATTTKTATKTQQICIFANEKQYFCTCIFHLLTFLRRSRSFYDVKITCSALVWTT